MLPLPFDGDTFMAERIRSLVSVQGIKAAVETGTAGGATTRFLSAIVEKVYTIEKSQEMYGRGAELDGLGNVTRFRDDSSLLLPKLLKNIEAVGPILLYLDGHDFYESPIVSELAALKELGPDAMVVVVIHDFQVPGTSLGFNTSNGLKGDMAISYENLKDVIANVFRLYTVEYNSDDTANGAKRGVAYITGVIR